MRLSIYMKSGNVIRLRGVKAYEVGYVGNEVRQLKIVSSWWSKTFGITERLVVKATDLSQIEAVTVG